MLPTDAELLDSYIRQKSDAAFCELAGRYIQLVHASATRQVRDSHLADDVTQAVFIVMARRAPAICAKYLPAWLLKTTRYCASDALRGQARRVYHEQQAAAMKDIYIAPHDSSADEIGTELDAALVRLKPRETTAITMRYLQNKSSADVALAMGISQDAAQKIIARSLPRLRQILTSRGLLLSSAAGLEQFMVTASHHPVPLHFSIKTSTAGSLIAKGAIKIMFWAKIKTAVAIAACIMVVGGGTGILLAYRDGSATAAIASPAGAAQTASNWPFESPYLQLKGCRIIQPMTVYVGVKTDIPSKPVNAIEQEVLQIDCAARPDIFGKTSRFNCMISSADGNTTTVMNVAIPKPSDGTMKMKVEIGFDAAQKPIIVGEHAPPEEIPMPEPGDYLVRVEAEDAAEHSISSAAVPLHVEPLPITQIQIDDIQPDGSIRFTAIQQGLNIQNQPVSTGGVRNSDFVHVEKMTDDQGKPIQFAEKHQGNMFTYRYRLNAAVLPGQPILGSTTGTMDGLVTPLGNGSFQYSMNQSPGVNESVHRIELYRLPAGAKLLSVQPPGLPHQLVSGRVQIFMETEIAPSGSQLVSFRYRLKLPR